MMEFLYIPAIAAGLLVLKSCIHIVGGKRAFLVETFGRPNKKALMPGLNIIFPWPIQSVSGRINLQLQEIKTDVEIKTSDNVFLKLPVAVQYRADSDPYGAVKAFYELAEPREQISSFILNNVRQSGAKMTLEQLFQSRDQLQSVVLEELAHRFSTYGYIIEAVLVDQPQPSAEVQASFNKVIASQRLLEAARNEAEAARIKMVKSAEAEAESKKLQGEGIANMRKAIAEGIDESLRSIKKAAPGLSDGEIMDFLTATNRLDTISTAASTGNLIVLDINDDTSRTVAANLIGTEAAGRMKKGA